MVGQAGGYPPDRMTSVVRAGSATLIIMYTVYVLKDKKGNLYKGMTNNLSRRLAEHKRGKTITIRRMKEIELIYKEEFTEKEEARARELYLKSATGRRFLKNILF